MFRDGDEVELGSRRERPMTRYLPEVVAAVRVQLPPRWVVDAEIVIASGPGLDFEALLQRIHPAATWVDLVSRETPAMLITIDLLALGRGRLHGPIFAHRCAALEYALAGPEPPVHLTRGHHRVDWPPGGSHSSRARPGQAGRAADGDAP